ncbi:MAG: histidine phosphatase family protein [Blastococcus sp.]
MPRLLLVRHATSVRPQAGGPSERSRPLSTQGRAEAERLADELIPVRPQRIFASPYLRAVQTVQPTACALGLEIECRTELREWESGLDPSPDWETHYRWSWAHPREAGESGESHAELTTRVRGALRAISTDVGADGVALIASHGTWIARALEVLGATVDVEFWLAMPSPAVFLVEAGLGD